MNGDGHRHAAWRKRVSRADGSAPPDGIVRLTGPEQKNP